jgi:hypothetical protein
MRIDLDDLRGAFGLGVAGNFAGHLEQAGEAGDFALVDAGPGEAPKGIFPWYAPRAAGFLGTFPLSHDRLQLPAEADAGHPADLQIEPEVGVLATVSYAGDGTVATITPTALAAFDDCSIRREAAPKISYKKNWGPASKGIAATGFAVAELDAGGATATFRLASFLRRDGVTNAYGLDSPLPGYSYYGATLLDWIAERLRGQRGADGTPLEDVGALLAAAGHPVRIVVGIGATRYTDFGAATFLRAGDEAIIVVYDGAVTDAAGVHAAVAGGREDELVAASVLRQVIVASAT